VVTEPSVPILSDNISINLCCGNACHAALTSFVATGFDDSRGFLLIFNSLSLNGYYSTRTANRVNQNDCVKTIILTLFVLLSCDRSYQVGRREKDASEHLLGYRPKSCTENL
jgi:hypothetical protein